MRADRGSGLRLAFAALAFLATSAGGQYEEIKKSFSKCRKSQKNFDSCIKKAANDIRPFFKFGIREYGVAPFDPHRAVSVEQSRGLPGAGYRLRLADVYERGWSVSEVTEFKTDWAGDRIVYSQYFPEKSLSGKYAVDARALGGSLKREGDWNLTLFDYSQTTTVTRTALPVDGRKAYDGRLDVKVEIDRIGNMDIHVSNILNGAGALESILDSVINASWRLGFVVVRPLINDLVSTAFTDIWSESFKNFPFDDFIRD